MTTIVDPASPDYALDSFPHDDFPRPRASNDRVTQQFAADCKTNIELGELEPLDGQYLREPA